MNFGKPDMRHTKHSFDFRLCGALIIFERCRNLTKSLVFGHKFIVGFWKKEGAFVRDVLT